MAAPAPFSARATQSQSQSQSQSPHGNTWSDDALAALDRHLDAALGLVAPLARDAAFAALDGLVKVERGAVLEAVRAAFNVVHPPTPPAPPCPAVTEDTVATVLGVSLDTARAVAAATEAVGAAPVTAYVINRAARTDRWDVMRRQIALAPFLRAERVDAVEGAALATDPTALQRLSLRARSTLLVKQVATDIDSWGAVGCTESHIRVWTAIVARGQPAFVFEDDAMLGVGKLALLAAALAHGARGLDYICLGSHTVRRPTAVVPLRLPLPPSAAAHARVPRHVDVQLVVPFPHGTLATGSHAYWVTPRAAAAFIECARPIEVAVDTYMQYVLAERCAYVPLMQGLRTHGAAPADSAPPPMVDATAVDAALLPPPQPRDGELWAGWMLATTTVASSSDIHHGSVSADTQEGASAAMANNRAAAPHDAREGPRITGVRSAVRGATASISAVFDRLACAHVDQRRFEDQPKGTVPDALEHKLLVGMILHGMGM